MFGSAGEGGVKLLTFGTLYPDRSRPRHGIFVETRLRQLLAQGDMEAVVVAPVPWFPFDHPVFGEYASYARVPAHEVRHGVAVHHPRYPMIPKLGMTLAPWLMALAVLPKLRRIVRDGYDFDAIDAHYFYPDGVAATLLGRWLGKPVVITARGTDVNLIPRYHLPRRMIQWAARHCAAIVTVSHALRDTLLALGADGERTVALRNGIDLNMFQPIDRRVAREHIGVSGPMLLSVGHLIEGKGHHVAIRALADLPGFQLQIIGEGPMRMELAQLAHRYGVASRVRFEATLSQDLLSYYYSAADALVLASSREGMPNVVLEALACGTPVVATAVGGVPEILTTSAAGVLMSDYSPESLALGIRQLLSDYPERIATRRYAEHFGWAETAEGLRRLFARVAAEPAA
jgi:glycosyltransferase involved in cell wall biosynthesis